MGCKSFGVTQVLVGLHRVGIVGLRQACDRITAAGLTDREGIVDLLLAELEADNYVPSARMNDYRVALWREYLRVVGEDFSDFFSTIEITIRGTPGEDRNRLAELCHDVFADFELRPAVDLEGATGGGPHPELVIDGETIVHGLPSRAALKTAIDHRLSDF